MTQNATRLIASALLAVAVLKGLAIASQRMVYLEPNTHWRIVPVVNN